MHPLWEEEEEEEGSVLASTGLKIVVHVLTPALSSCPGHWLTPRGVGERLLLAFHFREF